MPDPPDKGRPSSAPLSVEDADRLADSFTAFWEDAGAPATSGPIAAPSPLPGTVTAPMPAVSPVAVSKPIGKQTLLGMAPPNFQRPTRASLPVPAAVVATEPVPARAPAAATGWAEPEQPSPPLAASAHPHHKKTLLGYAAPSSLAAPAPSARPSVPPAERIQQSTPNVPGYAIAYTPKDPPSTPAVVIAPDAQSSPENKPPDNKRQFSQTVPSRVRSAPTASVAPLPPPPLADDFNPYAAKKGKGKLVLGLSGALLLVLTVLGVRSLDGEKPEPPAASAPRTDVVLTTTAVAAAPTPAPTEQASAAAPNRAPAAAKTIEREPAPLAARRASEPAPAKPKAKAKADSPSAAARPVTRALEPSPTPTKPASKGVIVRDAPF